MTETRARQDQPTRIPERPLGIAARLQAALLSVPLAMALAIGSLPGPSLSGTPAAPDITVWVVSHGWHSGIVVPAALAAAHDWPVRREFPQATYFEVGWGDRGFYPATEPGIWLGLHALLWPTPGVLHFVALQAPPQVTFPDAPSTAVRTSHEGAHRLAAAIAASHERGADGAAMALGPALYGQGRFYASAERFHLFATCNVWVARRLRDAGVELHPAFTLTSGMLLRQLAQSAGADPRPDVPGQVHAP